MSRILIAAAIAASAVAGAASATQLQVTVENLAPANGVALTPLLTVFHDGGFDLFNPGEAASAGLEAAAETGNVGGLKADADAAGGLTAVLSGAPIFSGGSASAMVDVDPATSRYFSFAAMVIPSNDSFVGNGDQNAHRLFDASGAFTGPLTITLTGAQIWDAGTEITDSGFAAFIAGANTPGGADESGTVFRSLAGVQALAGETLGNGQAFGGLSADDAFARITVTAAPVPLPAAAPLMVAGFAALLGFAGRRR